MKITTCFVITALSAGFCINLIHAQCCPANKSQPVVSLASDSQAEDSPAKQIDAPDPEAAKISPQLNRLLDNLEKTGAKLKSFQAKMLFTQQQLLIDTEMIRNGKLYYHTDKENLRFRIHFSDWLQRDLEDDEQIPQIVRFNEDVVFDGLWVTRRNERNKTIQKIEISRKRQNKEQFRLGKGPFPLPFAIRKADVLKEFDTKLLRAEPNDPAGTSHLLLKPKPKSSFADKYLRMDLWIGQKDYLPRQIRYETDDAEITTVTWSEIQADKPIADAVFKLEPADSSWSTEVTFLKEPTSKETSSEEPPSKDSP